MNKNSKIYIAGHNGTAGTALVENLKKRGFNNLILKNRQELDLRVQLAVNNFFEKEKPEYVFLAAVLPCGAANVSQRADFIYENTMIQNNIIYYSYKYNVKKLIFFGSGYMYPEKSPNPLREEYMLTDMLEYNANSFGVAKICGAIMCESYNLQYGTNFITLAINNLYGTKANFDFDKSRVLPALLRKFHLAKLLSNNDIEGILRDLNVRNFDEAKIYLDNFGISKEKVEIWGTGNVRREFLHSDDLADAAIYVMENINFKDLYDKNEKQIKNTHINIGTGIDYSIEEVAFLVKNTVGFNGDLFFNANRPDSSMDRLMDCSKIHSLGWKHKIELEDGIKMMYDWYLNQENIRS
ncbi:NAD-dependent epimerase/dehydratase family protein [Campylobacter volucris]|uniref:NAD-dependent epimerase/dehydratase family protein n=1 Tax=Campylobacter volucris TaxID=1031542 RepID=UPI00189F9167|nr:NAD-dependent epimerase/dehydratase family protein [Campylobacter volucris]MBF7044470.1 NAD-dependent epimerase/dehydratase family protein [Campylobacter volucris]